MTKFDVWVYRPDIEAGMRKINRNFVYDGRGNEYWDVSDRRKELNRRLDEALKKARQPKTKMEVPDD